MCEGECGRDPRTGGQKDVCTDVGQYKMLIFIPSVLQSFTATSPKGKETTHWGFHQCMTDTVNQAPSPAGSEWGTLGDSVRVSFYCVGTKVLTKAAEEEMEE